MKKLLSLAALLFGLVFLAPAAAYAAVDPFSGVDCSGAASTSAVCGSRGGTGNPVTTIIQKATTVISVLAGIVAVIIIIVAGINYILSGGDAAKVSSAKNTIIYAVIGLVVIVIARAIIIFVINRL